MEFNKTVGLRIKEARNNKQLSLKELGLKVGLSEGTMQRYETGQIKNVDINLLKKISEVLDCSQSYIMGWDAKTIAGQLRKYREQKKWSQEDLSINSFTPLERIMAFEKEEATPEGYEISALANALDVSIFDIYPNMPIETYKDTYAYAKNSGRIDEHMHDGVISFLYEIYGDVHEIFNSSSKYLHFWEIGLPPNTFILTEDNMEHLKEVAKTSVKVVADYLGRLNQEHNHTKRRTALEESADTYKASDSSYTKVVPLYPKLASAGTGEYLFDDIPTNTIKIDSREYPKGDYAIQVNGDSMEPTYYDGDTLIVERNAIPAEGQVGIFIVDGRGYVKRMGNGELLSDNKAYESIVGEYGKCLGKVLGKL